MFEYGLQFNKHHMSTLMGLIGYTGDKTTLSIALRQGRDINPLAIFGPPVLG